MWPTCRSASMLGAARLCAALACAVPCTVAPLQAQASHADLWGVEAPLVFRLSFDRKKVYSDRDTLSTKSYPAVLT